MSTAKPNIIVVMCDQLRAFEVGCYGNTTIRTPHIDRLAREGVRFEHAVSNNPICMPSRSSLLSGQYSRTCNGTVGNFTAPDESGKQHLPELPVKERAVLLDATLPEQLQTTGYTTALIGKWHIHPAPELLGFDYSRYPYVHHRHTGQTFICADGSLELVEGFSVDDEARHVEQYLAEERDQPFFMFYNISPPHMPLDDAPESYKTMYPPDSVPLRANVYDQHGQPAYNEEWFKIYLWDFLYYQQHLPHTAALPEGFGLEQLTALYYGLTTWVDDTVGKLMAALHKHGHQDNTVVVFLSDHGDNLGSHQKFNKSELYEESIRIPLIFHAPPLWEPRINSAQVAQIVDIMPTLLELAGVQVPIYVQGRSLRPILQGTASQLPASSGFIETESRLVGIRTTHHLYGIRLAEDLRAVEDDAAFFFDLRSDPFQLHNMARTDEQAETAAQLRQQVLTWTQETRWLTV